MTPNRYLTDPAAAKELSSEQWVALHVPRYAQAAPAYVEYEAFLKTVLRDICNKLAPLAVVEARAKGIPSFAEKVLRKRDSYQNPSDRLPPDPIVRLTDLCGGRIICQTAQQVHAVCLFIEKAFIIDWANSEDVSRRLKTAEFGYRSVHYIIQVDPRKLQEAGIETPVPPALLGFAKDVLGEQAAGIPLKAEIQVRTLLEHASSDLERHSIYKTGLKVPERIKRRYAALAAVLEGADREIERLLAAFDEFRSNFGAWHEKPAVINEIDHARILLGLPDTSLPVSHKIPVAVRAAKLALAIGEHEQAIALLEPFAALSHAGVQRVLGQALVELHWHEPNCAGFAQGQAHLRQAAELTPTDAETLGLLAESAALENDDVEARRLFALAVAADGTEPLTLARYLEFEAAHLGNDNPLRLASPMIRTAIARAERQIEARANLASAWSAVAVFHLFLREPFLALAALAQVVRLCDQSAPNAPGKPARPCAAGRALLRLRETIRRLGDIRGKLDGFDWFERFLLLALATRLDDPHARAELVRLASWASASGPAHFHANQKTVFLAGGCAPDARPFMVEFGQQMRRACEGLSLVLLSGGTNSGISGVAGDVAAASGGRIQAFGYLPSYPPLGTREDTDRFVRCFRSPGKDFTPLDPLQGWTDLVAGGLAPTDVKVVCYAPGDIGRAECAVALALGARVGLVLDAALPKYRLFEPTLWDGCSNLLLLPKDDMTLRAFLQIDHHPLSDADKRCLEPAARLAHEDYVKSATPKEASLQSWDNLSDILKLSNYHQVAYWEQTLRQYGLGVRRLAAGTPIPALLVMDQVFPRHGDKDSIAELAELEHGRWNVERLACGWRYAKEKDVLKKRSPWLIPWNQVPPAIQKFDLDAIVGLPKKLREAGLELYKL
ncbi:MAG: hypothetical protein WC378_00410 [Opitutaceae bacterium]|jgi:ppGpp synthetase/RelA/SpoT-type nucleotidyltranferase